jgi:hypothetical protein
MKIQSIVYVVGYEDKNEGPYTVGRLQMIKTSHKPLYSAGNDAIAALMY